MYKKIYLEITNNCNLKCPFCIQNKRKNEFISIDNFKIILSKIKDYTKYLYFHVLGEPLLHPNINELINVASKDFYINITTNGYLINKIKDNQNIRQVNISLHSFNSKYNLTLEEYLNNIISVINNLPNTYFSLRFWVDNENNLKMKEYLENYFHKEIKLEENFKINSHVFISIGHEFIWPTLTNNYYSDNGKCYALKDHIGILVDGTIIPCCLDTEGIINLGNIYQDNLDDIINSKRYQTMLKCFQENKRCEELCKKCNFLD